jgi:4-hydroxybenzoate polyprenyltransferase
MIKWEHSVFALPFALNVAVLSASGWPHPCQLFWIVVFMVLARSAGMAFNRWADGELDDAKFPDEGAPPEKRMYVQHALCAGIKWHEASRILTF